MRAELGRALAALGATEVEPWLVTHAGNELLRVRLGGRPAVAKRHRSHRAYAQERDAYRDLAPALAGRAPALLGELREHRVLLLSDLGGAPLEAAGLGPEALRAAYGEAGRLLGRLHAMAVEDPDPLPLGRALLARLDRLAAEAPSDALEALRARLARPGGHGRRVRCHRDFSPQNFVVLPGGALGLVDFEHARLDDAHVDLARLFLTAEGLDEFAAARAAYPWPVDDGWLLALAELDARQTEAWARRHRDAAFLARAERGLARVLAHR